MIAALFLTAFAHPGSYRVAGHDVRVLVTPSALVLDYSLEVPSGAITAPAVGTAQGGLPDAAELATGFRLTIDGVAIPLLQRSPAVYRSSPTMHGIETTLWAPLDHPDGTLILENANFPDLPGLHHTTYAVQGLDVTQVTSNTRGSGGWAYGPSYRTSSIGVSPTPALCWIWRPAQYAARPAAQAMPPDLRASHPRESLWGALAGTLLLAVIAATRDRRAAPSPLTLIAAVGVMGAAAAFASGPLAAIACVGAASAASRGSRRWLPIATAGAVAATAGAWPLTVIDLAVVSLISPFSARYTLPLPAARALAVAVAMLVGWRAVALLVM